MSMMLTRVPIANLATTARYLHPDAARVQEMVEGL